MTLQIKDISTPVLKKEEQRHKYKVGDVVYDSWNDETVTILQKRIENGHRCYRLDSGSIRNEKYLKG